MIRPAFYLPVLAPGGPQDTHLRFLTFHFGHRNALNPVNPILSEKHDGTQRMFRSEFDGIYYRESRMATDGEGRTVADAQRTDPPDWLI